MDRLEKNKQIAQTMKETYNKRKSQDCKCFKFKIDKSNLSKTQANQLKMQFVEAKWIYNYLLDKDIYNFDYKNLSKITHKDKNRNDIETTIQYVGSSVKQSIIQDVINQIKGLSTLKKKGHNVGKLKFKSEYNSSSFSENIASATAIRELIKNKNFDTIISNFISFKSLNRFDFINFTFAFNLRALSIATSKAFSLISTA